MEQFMNASDQISDAEILWRTVWKRLFVEQDNISVLFEDVLFVLEGLIDASRIRGVKNNLCL